MSFKSNTGTIIDRAINELRTGRPLIIQNNKEYWMFFNIEHSQSKIFNQFNKHLIDEKYLLITKQKAQSIFNKNIKSNIYFEINPKTDVNQIVNLIDKMLHLNIVYYDIKPENIVVRMDGNKQLVLKFIDWDSDFCVEEDWIIEDDNRECAKFMEIFILGFYMYRFYNHNIFYNKIIELYNETIKKNLVKLLIDIDSEFLHIILNYFYRSMSMTHDEKENFDYGDDKMIKKVEKDILGLIEKSKNFCKTV